MIKNFILKTLTIIFTFFVPCLIFILIQSTENMFIKIMNCLVIIGILYIVFNKTRSEYPKLLTIMGIQLVLMPAILYVMESLVVMDDFQYALTTIFAIIGVPIAIFIFLIKIFDYHKNKDKSDIFKAQNSYHKLNPKNKRRKNK